MYTAPKPTSNHNAYVFRQALLIALIFILLLAANLMTTPAVQASPQIQSTSTPTAQPTPTFDVRRLEQPVIASDNTDQLKKGSEIYWGICMACHGDIGQGLTDEWSDAFGEADRNCWQSGCHGHDHPPQGFLIPKDKVIPGVAGSGKLARFKNAQELHDYVLANMPWWDPGQLTDEETCRGAAEQKEEGDAGEVQPHRHKRIRHPDPICCPSTSR